MSLKWLFIGSFVFGLAFGWINFDGIVNWVPTVKIHALGSAKAQSGKAADKSKPNAVTKAPGDRNIVPVDSSTSDAMEVEKTKEEASYMSDLVARKAQLDEREKELKKVEEELSRQRDALAEKMQELEEMRKNISAILSDRVTQDNERIDRLVLYYSAMKPANAAKVFEKLDEDLATEILGRMKKSNAAEIMNKLSAPKAQKLSEKYAGYISR